MRTSLHHLGLAAILSLLTLAGCDALLGEEPPRPLPRSDAANVSGLDAGPTATDAQAVHPDANTPAPDADTATPDADEPDAVAPGPDAAHAVDAGAPPDAAAPTPDAATAHADANLCWPDAGSSSADAASDPPDAGGSADGGCAYPSYACPSGCCRRLVAGGGLHTCATDPAGDVYCWGAWGAAETGHTPTMILGTSKVLALAAGWSFSCAIDSNFTLSCWGSNDWGELGAGGFSTVPHWDAIATKLPDGANAVSAGFGHACAINGKGFLYCWGANDRSQLGLGYVSAFEATPQPVSWSKQAIGLAVGYQNACVMAYVDSFSQGALYCWGNDSHGELADPSGIAQATPTTISSMQTGVSSVAHGAFHVCAVKDKKVFCWGANDHRQVKHGGVNCGGDLDSCYQVNEISTPPALDVVAGANHSCALLESRKVVCWGSNAVGQVGHDSACIGDVPVPTEVVGLDEVGMISAGLDHTCAVRKDQIWCWGSNRDGQLGRDPASFPEARSPVLVSW